VVLSVREQYRARLGKVFGRSLAGSSVSLGGIRLILEPARTTRISALVINCKDLKRFMRAGKIKSSVLWQGKRAAVIKNPDRRMWDIVAVEK
jgi:hypothetical protein